MSTRITRRRSLLILGITLLIVLLVAALTATVAAQHNPRPRTWQAVAGIQSQDQAIQGMAFLPGTLWINVGDSVIWTARGAEPHTITFLKPGEPRPPFNQNDPLQVLRQGGHTYDGRSTFVKAGTYAFRCDLHDDMGMLATIVVLPR